MCGMIQHPIEVVVTHWDLVRQVHCRLQHNAIGLECLYEHVFPANAHSSPISAQVTATGGFDEDGGSRQRNARNDRHRAKDASEAIIGNRRKENVEWLEYATCCSTHV